MNPKVGICMSVLMGFSSPELKAQRRDNGIAYSEAMASGVVHTFRQDYRHIQSKFTVFIIAVEKGGFKLKCRSDRKLGRHGN